MGTCGTKETKAPEPIVEPVPPREVDYKQIHSKVRWNRDFEDIKDSLFNKEACNCVDPGNGNTPLHIASQNGHLNVTQLLLERGSEVNAQNLKGNTSLHMAISYDYYDVVKALIASGGDLERINSAGFPAKRGLDGDKSLALLHLSACTTTADLLLAFKECNDSLNEMDKASFISYAFKAKKAVKKAEPPVWTDEVQQEFQKILDVLQ